MQPKFDHGWGRLPRLQAIYRAKLKLNQYEGQVYGGIEYFCTGFSKKWETISLKQLADITGIKRNHVPEIVKSLVKKKAVEVKESRYRLIFYNVNGVPHTGDTLEVGGTWSGQDYTHTGVNSSPHRTKGPPQGGSPKTLSKDSLRLPPKKKEIFSKLSEEEIEKNKKRALDIVEELKKKYGG